MVLGIPENSCMTPKFMVLAGTSQNDRSLYNIQWHKSFSEGYGRTAGENNFHIYPLGQCAPVHVFLTMCVDNKKAMEKKESFMLEYYSADERMKPIRLL